MNLIPKSVQIALLLFAVSGLLMVSLSYCKILKQKPDIREHTTTIRTTEPVITKIIEKRVPAVIETMYVQTGESYEMAYYHTKIDTNRVSVDLSVRYNEHSNLFDVAHHIVTQRDSIVIETVKEITITKPPKFIRLATQLGIGLRYDKERSEIRHESADVALGIKFIDRYSVLAFVDSRKTYGLRFGVDF